MALEEPLDDFFDLADFAEAVEVGGAQLNAIFRNEPGEAFGIQGTVPVLTVPTANLGVIVEGTTTAEARGVSYVVMLARQDASGRLTRLALKRA